MSQKKSVIIVSDGDHTAFEAIKKASHELHLFPIGASRGNPTPISSQTLISDIAKSQGDPVVVMVDDQGDTGFGKGERVLKGLLQSQEIDVLGVVAVAANSHPVKGIAVDDSVDQEASLVSDAVDKDGHTVASHVLRGDTVDILNQFPQVPVVGLGDPGKMNGHDSLKDGAPATKAALVEILKRSGHHVGAV